MATVQNVSRPPVPVPLPDGYTLAPNETRTGIDPADPVAAAAIGAGNLAVLADGPLPPPPAPLRNVRAPLPANAPAGLSPLTDGAGGFTLGNPSAIFDGSLLLSAALDDTGRPAVEVTSRFGIDAHGVPYFDPDGAADNEQAVLTFEPDARGVVRPFLTSIGD